MYFIFYLGRFRSTKDGDLQIFIIHETAIFEKYFSSRESMSVENLPTLGLPFLIMTLERMLALLALYKVFIICCFSSKFIKFFWLGFTLCKAEQQLRGIELQEKLAQKD